VGGKLRSRYSLPHHLIAASHSTAPHSTPGATEGGQGQPLGASSRRRIGTGGIVGLPCSKQNVNPPSSPRCVSCDTRVGNVPKSEVQGGRAAAGCITGGASSMHKAPDGS